MKQTLTVFTPAYNRAYTLPKCYESLQRQTCKDFVWLIIDDGSTDGTRELVTGWIKEDLIPIRYHYQPNQGMHGAHNAAYRLINTELNVCIDSDDYLTDNAVEMIVAFWRRYGAARYSGIIALNARKDGDVIGTRLPDQQKDTTLTGFYRNGGRGDKKLVYRTEVMKKIPPYPVFAGEKYFGLNYKYILADQEYSLLILDEVLCIVEYMPDGSSRNMLSQYKKNPRGFAELRKFLMKYSSGWLDTYKQCIHYVSSSLMLRNRDFIAESPRRWATFFAIPFGILLYLFVTCLGRGYGGGPKAAIGRYRQ